MLELVKRAPTIQINFINISNKYKIPTRIFIQIFKSISFPINIMQID